MYCQVINLDIVSQEFDKLFTYHIPEKMQKSVKKGSLIKIPLGKRVNLGLVINLIENPNICPEKIKSIVDLLRTDVLSDELIETCYWMKNYYVCSLAKAINVMLPRGLKLEINQLTETNLFLNESETNPVNKLPANAKKQREIVEYLQNVGKITFAELKEKLQCTDAPIKSLRTKNILLSETRRIYREPINYDQINNYVPPEPTQEQQSVLELIKNQLYSDNEKAPLLLYGVTGSGKTEIYLQSIKETLEQGKDVIVLIPEISLTPQTISRFVGRFARNVAVLHSKLSVGEKLDEWDKIRSGEAKIVIGPRSAVFAPCQNLGMIIIDEEHENSYKQEEAPRYHARTVAEFRCKLAGAQLVLGSATPSVESIYHVGNNKYQYCELPKRVTQKQLPSINIVDMKSEFQRGNRSIFSRELQKQIKAATDNNEQVILFLNRRGFASFLLCRECGHTVTCPRCEVTLTYHSSVNRLICHYCDYTEPLVEHCPECQSGKIKEFGTGTQKIEAELKKFFPYLSAIRMDVDTTRKKGAHERLLSEFRQQKASVLIGTQMIAKGLHLPKVSVVGVITADTALNLPDFRSGEKTYQLLTQVSGRAGRGDVAGQVVVQTYNPEHYAIQAVKDDDINSFYTRELNLRKQLSYPPYKKLIRLLFRSTDEEELEKQSDKIAEELIEQDFEVLGPNPCPIPKIKDEYRWHLLIKLNITDGNHFFENHEECNWKEYLYTNIYNLIDSCNLKMAINVDPVNLL